MPDLEHVPDRQRLVTCFTFVTRDVSPYSPIHLCSDANNKLSHRLPRRAIVEL
jgi:hypothetical protein